MTRRILFLGGTISQYLASTGQGPFAYDFKLLSGAFHFIGSDSSLEKRQIRVLLGFVEVCVNGGLRSTFLL